MEYIKIEPKKFNILSSSNDYMKDIAIFLMSDLFSGDLTFRDWLQDESIIEMEGNFFLLIRKGKNIFMSCKYDEDFYAQASQFPTTALIGLLEQWNMVCKMNPDEVTITYDQGKFHVEGKVINNSKKEEIYH